MEIGKGIIVVHIERRDEQGVTVRCPFCREEHTHSRSGVNTALCGQGQYSAITPLAPLREGN